MNTIIQNTKTNVANIIDTFGNFTTKNQNVVFLILGIIYRISLDIYYILAVSPSYAYGGLTLNPNGIKYIISWMVYLAIYLMITKDECSIPSFFLNLQFAIIFAPMTSYYSLDNQSTIYLLFVSIAIIAQIWILKPNNAKIEVSFSLFNADRYVSIFMIILIPILLLLAILWGGFYGFEAFDLAFLNKIREHAEYPTILIYLFWWLIYGIIPFYLALSLYKKRYIISCCLILIDILLYMVLGYKTIYLSLIVMLVIFIASKLKLLINGIYLGLSTLCLTSTLLYVLEQHANNKTISGIITAFVGVRFLFGPALNKFLYYDFFSQYPKVYFADGQIGNAFGLTYPYNGSIGQTIYAFMCDGRLYQSNSNTGYFGDSYAQFGFIGVILLSILLAFIIKFVNGITNKLDYTIIVTALSVQIIILNDGALLTTLLSNGFTILIGLFLIYSKPDEKIFFRRNLK